MKLFLISNILIWALVHEDLGRVRDPSYASVGIHGSQTSTDPHVGSWTLPGSCSNLGSYTSIQHKYVGIYVQWWVKGGPNLKILYLLIYFFPPNPKKNPFIQHVNTFHLTFSLYFEMI